MTFTNFDQLDLVNINQQNIAKAWVVLFHFRSKSIDSNLYEEFSIFATRNSNNKASGHEFFTKFHNEMLNNSYTKGYKVNLGRKCASTGWPIDMSIEPLYADSGESGASR